MNILITGATGFIGGSVCKKLLDGQDRVHVLARDRNFEFSQKVKKHVGDLRNYKSLEKALNGIDVVINCAAVLPHHKLEDFEYRKINVEGVENILKACIKNKVKRLIHISTVGMYGPTGRLGADETAVPSPGDIYSRTKLEGDKIIKNNMMNIPSIIIRPTIAYGPGDLRPVILRLFRMIKWGINPSIGGGSNYLHTIYIDDLVNAIIISIRKRGIEGRDFIIGDKKCPKMKDIVRTIASVQKKNYFNIYIPKSLAIIASRFIGLERTVRFASEDRRYKIDNAIKVLGFKPKTNLLKGMKQTYLWYVKNGYL